MSARTRVLIPLLRENPVTVHVLGICSALAITNSLASALIMSASMTIVLVISNLCISLIRRQLPASVRLVVQITIIAAAVTIIDQLISAYLPDTSRILSVYVGLIVTNCIVLGRAEGFAMQNPPGASVLDAIGNGLGYSLILILVATVRELLGSGSLLGIQVLEPAGNGGWFQPNALLLLAPSAFFIIGFLIWIIRCLNPEQREEPEFTPPPLQAEEEW